MAEEFVEERTNHEERFQADGGSFCNALPHSAYRLP
jgi:hypothetical protein